MQAKVALIDADLPHQHSEDASDPYNSLLWYRSGFLMFCVRGTEFAVSDWTDAADGTPTASK